MPNFSKVAWKDHLFLQPHHFQQAERYPEDRLRERTASLSRYPCGQSALRFDRDLARHGKFGFRAVVAIMPGGMPFAGCWPDMRLESSAVPEGA